jgi:hypothetical protein
MLTAEAGQTGLFSHQYLLHTAASFDFIGVPIPYNYIIYIYIYEHITLLYINKQAHNTKLVYNKINEAIVYLVY